MSTRAAATVLASAPPELRHQILKGVRWTLWLSVLSVPFSYANSVILARLGPEALGTFGLLQLYIGVTSVFFFLGGNAVAIRFLPQIARDRHLPFLASYFSVVLLAFVPWLIAAVLWPRSLNLLFGDALSYRFALLLLALAPVYILSSLVLAALKGLMDIKTALLLDRIVTVGSCFIYAALFFFARPLFANHLAVIWFVYFALAAICTAIGLRRLIAHTGWATWNQHAWFLPSGFWHYTLFLQSDSVLGFLSTRLDLLLIFHAGGLVALGQYAAVISLTAIVTRLIGFACDALLPSLSNALAHGNAECARELLHSYTRLLLPAILTAASLIVLFAPTLTTILGARYRNLTIALVLAGACSVIEALNLLAGTIVAASGMPRINVVCKVVRFAVFVAAFWAFWVPLGITGVVLSRALAEAAYHVVCVALFSRHPSMHFPVLRTYTSMLLGIALATLLSTTVLHTANVGLSMVSWLAAQAMFYVAARYSPSEIRNLSKFMLVARGLA